MTKDKPNKPDQEAVADRLAELKADPPVVVVAEPGHSRGISATALSTIENRIVLDVVTYDKTNIKKSGCKLGTGYQTRQNADGILAIVVHTTNGNKGSTVEAEAEWLMKSKEVSTHFVISKPDKDGKIKIYQIVPPYLNAWAVGKSQGRGYAEWNELSISVEIHCAGDDGEFVSEDQKAALAWLCTYLRRQYPHIYMLERHADVAIPTGRKHDPNGWADPNDPKADPLTAWKRWVAKNW